MLPYRIIPSNEEPLFIAFAQFDALKAGRFLVSPMVSRARIK
jgi:hypothetical protein